MRSDAISLDQELNVHLEENLQSFHNIWRLSDVLPNFLFTTSEAIEDYYLYMVYIQVDSQVAKRLKT